MGSGGVVVGHPVGNDAAGMVETEEQRFVPEFASQMPLCIGLSGAMQCQGTLVSSLHASIAFEVNSVP